MDITFFFTHLSQDPRLGAPWVAFQRAFEEKNSNQGGESVECLVSENQPTGTCELQVLRGTTPLRVDSAHAMDASQTIDVEAIEVDIRDFVAEIDFPLNPARMRQEYEQRVPRDDFQLIEQNFPIPVEGVVHLDASHVGEFDSSSSSFVQNFFTSAVSFDLDEDWKDDLEGLYGPAIDWSDPGGIHVRELLDDPLIAEIWQTDPFLLRWDLSASGFHYPLSTDSDLFFSNSTEVNFPGGFLKAQLIDGFVVNCLVHSPAYLYVADLPDAVRSFYHIFHDFSGLPPNSWYSHHWLRFFLGTSPIHLFPRKVRDNEAPLPPALLHPYDKLFVRREHTDVPLDTVSHSEIVRFEADQSAMGFADSSVILANTTELHTGSLWPEGTLAEIQYFTVFSSTIWLTADLWPITTDRTLLIAGQETTVFSTDSLGRIVVPGWEPPDPAPPILVPPPSTISAFPTVLSLPAPQLTASSIVSSAAEITVDSTLELQEPSDTVWMRVWQLDVSSTWVTVDAPMTDDTTLVEVQSFEHDTLFSYLTNNGSSSQHFLVTTDNAEITADALLFIGRTGSTFTATGLPNHRFMTADCTAITADMTFSLGFQSFALAPIVDMPRDEWARIVLLSADSDLSVKFPGLTADALYIEVEHWSTADLSHWLNVFGELAVDGNVSVTTDQWDMPNEITADQSNVYFSRTSHPIDASAGWIFTNSSVRANDIDFVFLAEVDNPPSPFWVENQTPTLLGFSWALQAPDGIPADILRASHQWLTADVRVRVNDLRFERVLQSEADGFFSSGLFSAFVSTALGVLSLSLSSGTTFIGAGSTNILASFWLTADTERLTLLLVDPPTVLQYHPRFFVSQENRVFESGSVLIEYAPEDIPVFLFSDDQIHLDSSHTWLTADLDQIVPSDTNFEVVFAFQQDVAPPIPINPPDPPSPDPLEPGGPYFSHFDLPSYLYPTFQKLHPVSADLDFLVCADRFLTADSTFVSLPGVLDLVPFVLQTVSAVRADAEFTGDSVFLTCDNVEMIFDLEEKKLLPQACSLPPNQKPPTGDTTFLPTERWINPWWVGQWQSSLFDWPVPTTTSNTLTPWQLPRSQSSWSLRNRIFSVQRVPKGKKQLHLKASGTTSVAMLPEEGRGYLPSSTLSFFMEGAKLSEIAWGLLALLAEGRLNVLAQTLQEIVHVWSVDLNNVFFSPTGPELNTAVTWGLPPFLARDPSPSGHSAQRDVFELAWLGFALTQISAAFSDRQEGNRLELPALLPMLLDQLGFLVANAIDPVSGWTVRLYNPGGFLEGPTDYPTTVMATVFLSELLALRYDSNLHDRAAVAWVAIADGPAVPIPEVFGIDTSTTNSQLIAYKLLWAARFREQLDVERLIEAFEPDGSLPVGMFEALLKELKIEHSVPNFGTQYGQNVWGIQEPSLVISAWRSILSSRLPFFRNPPFRLFANEALAQTSFSFQLEKWMWPFGYHWMSLDAEAPGGGDLGVVLFAIAFTSFFWALRFFMVRQGRHLSLAQGTLLDAWGQDLGFQRKPLQSDTFFRQQLLLWLRSSRGTTLALRDYLDGRHRSPHRVIEAALGAFESFETRQGALQDQQYNPFVFETEPWQADDSQLERLFLGGAQIPFTTDLWEIDASSSQTLLFSAWPRRGQSIPLAFLNLTADADVLDNKVNLPGFFQAVRVDNNEIDVSEDWVSGDAAQMFVPLSALTRVTVLISEPNADAAREMRHILPASIRADVLFEQEARAYEALSSDVGFVESTLIQNFFSVSTLSLEVEMSAEDEPILLDQIDLEDEGTLL